MQDFDAMTFGLLTEEDLMGIENYVVYHDMGIDTTAHRLYTRDHGLTFYTSEYGKQRGMEGSEQVRGLWEFALHPIMVHPESNARLSDSDPIAITDGFIDEFDMVTNLSCPECRAFVIVYRAKDE